MTGKIRYARCSTQTIALALAMAPPVTAYAAAPAADEAASPAAVTAEPAVPDIIVTAQKSSQSLQSVAGSISAISANQILNRGIASIADIVEAVPSLNLTNSSGTPRLTIRGVGLQVATGVAETNIAQHVDGVFQSQPTMSTVAPVDLERIEVLRGPQGTLYGRNATGGTINFITKKPTSTLEMGASGGISSFQGRQVDGYISGPIAGNVLEARVSGYFERNRGYYFNETTGHFVNGDRRYGFRGALRFIPTTNFTVDLDGYYQKQDASAPVQTLLRGVNPVVAELEAAGYLPAGYVKSDTTPYRTAAPDDSYLRSNTSGATLTMALEDSDALSIHSVTGYTHHHYGPSMFDSDGTSLPVVTIGNASDPRQQYAHAFSQELNFSGKIAQDRIRYLLGGYYFSGKLDASIPAYFPNIIIESVLGAAAAPGALFTGIHQIISEKTKSFAAFADVTYSLTPALRLNLGGRYSHDTKNTGQSVSSDLVFGGVPVNVPSCTNLYTGQTFNKANGKARIEWNLDKNVLTYAQYQTGFKDGGVNLSVCGNTFKPEQLTSFEGGIKSTFLNGATTLNASIFHYKYRDLQFLNFLSATNTQVTNIPLSETTGGEIELFVRPVTSLVFNASAALLNAKIKEFQSFDTENPGAGLQSLAGNQLPNSPKASYNLGVDYTIPTAIGKLLARAELYHSSSYDFRQFGNAIDRQNPYSLVNLFLTYTTPGDHYAVRAYVKNVGDTKYLNTLIFSSLTGVVGDYARPREWGVSLAAKF